MTRRIRLKIDPAYIKAVAAGVKTFEIRYNDRWYEVGDILELAAWTSQEDYTDDEVCVRVTYVLSSEDFPGLSPGYVALAIVLTPAPGEACAGHSRDHTLPDDPPLAH